MKDTEITKHLQGQMYAPGSRACGNTITQLNQIKA